MQDRLDMLQDVLFCSDSYWKAFSDTSFNVRSMALEYVPRARLGKEALARGVAARVEIPGTTSSMWNLSCGVVFYNHVLLSPATEPLYKATHEALVHALGSLLLTF
jgi:hypothetical protein